MFKKYFSIVIVLLILSCQKQDSKLEPKVDEIKFSYESGLRIPYNVVKINISRMSTGDSAVVFIESRPANNDPQWEYSKIEKFVIIDFKTFNKFAEIATSLDKIEIEKAYRQGYDGSTWEIQFGSKGKNKSYSFWSPKSNSKERGLSKFVALCEEIVEVSKLNKKEILGN